jgi:endonuclease YncB( thermonuclease family)
MGSSIATFPTTGKLQTTTAFPIAIGVVSRHSRSMFRLIMFFMAFCFAVPALAHGGGLDASGCHNDRKRGGYHCHRGASAPAPVYRAPVRRSVPSPAAIRAQSYETVPATLVSVPATTTPPALPEPIIGIPQVLDGDTIQIGTTRIRLFGIDAFEAEQMCVGAESSRYGCGGRATRALTELISANFTVCVPKGIDAYGRQLAVCRVNTVDLSAAMVRQGHALAYLKYALDYVYDEEQAKQDKVGAWSGGFIPPWEFRVSRPSGAAEAQRTSIAPSADCTIKGNVNAKGDRIYHMEGTRDYARTKPENWFCSTEEAETAGFRRAGSPR